MKKFLLLFVILCALCSCAFADTTPKEIIDDSIKIINEMFSEDDVSDLASTLRSSHAIAIVPSMLKAGFLIGGEYGEGLVLRRKDGKWFGPSFYNIGGGSFGFQIGAQSVSLLLAVINEKGVEAFMSSRTKLGGDIAVTAGPVGRRAEAATDAQVKASIYSYSMTKGLFAGFSLEGSVISISVKRNQEYWGKKISASDALEKPANSKMIQPLLKVLDKLVKEAK